MTKTLLAICSCFQLWILRWLHQFNLLPTDLPCICKLIKRWSINSCNIHAKGTRRMINVISVWGPSLVAHILIFDQDPMNLKILKKIVYHFLLKEIASENLETLKCKRSWERNLFQVVETDATNGWIQHVGGFGCEAQIHTSQTSEGKESTCNTTELSNPNWDSVHPGGVGKLRRSRLATQLEFLLNTMDSEKEGYSP